MQIEPTDRDTFRVLFDVLGLAMFFLGIEPEGTAKRAPSSVPGLFLDAVGEAAAVECVGAFGVCDDEILRAGEIRYVKRVETDGAVGVFGVLGGQDIVLADEGVQVYATFLDAADDVI